LLTRDFLSHHQLSKFKLTLLKKRLHFGQPINCFFID